MRDILAEARPSGSPSSAIERLVEARQGLKASSDALALNGLLRRLFKGIKIDIEAKEMLL
jgi:hypothetical protein